MAKKRADSAPMKREGRVMLSFEADDYSTLKRQAKEAKLAIATYARILCLKQMAIASGSR